MSALWWVRGGGNTMSPEKRASTLWVAHVGDGDDDPAKVIGVGTCEACMGAVERYFRKTANRSARKHFGVPDPVWTPDRTASGLNYAEQHDSGIVYGFVTRARVLG